MRQNTPSTDRAGNASSIDPASLDISSEKFEEMSASAVKFIESQLGEDTMMPHFLVWARPMVKGMAALGDVELSVYAIAQDFTDPHIKRGLLRSIGLRTYDENLAPVAVFMASEIWVATVPGGETMKHKMPSEDPNRKEALMATGIGLNSDGKFDYISTMIPIRRDEKNLMQRDGENQTMTMGDGGLLMEFFNGFFEVIRKKPQAGEL